jgi:hypothetical protein
MHPGTGDLQQCGLAGTVRAEHHPALAVADGPGHVLQEGRAIPDHRDADEVEHVTHDP